MMLGVDGFHPCDLQAGSLGHARTIQPGDNALGLKAKRSRLQRLAGSLCKRIGKASLWLKSLSNLKMTAFFVARGNAAIQFAEGDTLLLPDAYWALPSIWPWVQRARRDGARTAIVIYDLIPHTHSDLYSSQGADGFRQYIRTACEHADCLVAISQTVRHQLIEQLPMIIGRNTFPFFVKAFELGAEFANSSEPIRDDVLQIFDCTEHELPYLMVGTIEVRKNHAYTLDAMERLWAHYPNRRLCIVGRPGWKGEPIIERVVNHDRYGKQLFWINNASDADLLHCYRHAYGVIFPSVTEGFGLPIVESLWHGCDTFASDIPIHREVGKNRCEYFSLENADSLVDFLLVKELKLIERRVANYVMDDSKKQRLMSWSESVRELMGVINHALNDVERAVSSPSDYRMSA